MNIPILSVYDADGNEIPIPAIRGEKGETGDTGAQGPQGTAGATGPQGPKGDKGDTGQNGHTPVRGVDYWTTGDKAEIIEDVLEEICQGADLGLQIVTQLNQPSNPSDNMIWVETETAMPVGKYMVSSQPPTGGLVSGFLWFREMYLPLVEIAMPGSHVSMSIAQVWQYENGAWVWKKGHVYKSAEEEWKDTGVYWFKSGVGMNSAVFGAVCINGNFTATDPEALRINAGGTSPSFISTQTAVPPGKYHYLVIDETNSGSTLRAGICSAYNDASSFTSYQDLSPQARNTTVIDISSASAEF